MNILITGASGFVSKNMTYVLKNIKHIKDRAQQGLIRLQVPLNIHAEHTNEPFDPSHPDTFAENV